MLVDDQECPCDCAESYADCCGRYHNGAAPPTALALMRSRYSAFALGKLDYLLHSWHPRTRPQPLHLDPDQRWLGLKIKAVEAGGEDDDTGLVSFAARYKIAGKGYRLEERSSFARLTADPVTSGGRWVYVDGELK